MTKLGFPSLSLLLLLLLLKVFGVLPLQRHPSPLSGSIWSFHYYFFHLYFSYHFFTSISFFFITVPLVFFLSLSSLSWFFLHVPAFSCLFLISLCPSIHICSKVLFFVLLLLYWGCYHRIRNAWRHNSDCKVWDDRMISFSHYFRVLRTGILQGLGLFLRFWVCARTCFQFATLPLFPYFF